MTSSSITTTAATTAVTLFVESTGSLEGVVVMVSLLVAEVELVGSISFDVPISVLDIWGGGVPIVTVGMVDGGSMVTVGVVDGVPMVTVGVVGGGSMVTGGVVGGVSMVERGAACRKSKHLKYVDLVVSE